MEIHHFLIEESKTSTVSACFVNGKFMCYILEDGGNQVKVKGSTRVDAGGPYKVMPIKVGRIFNRLKDELKLEFALLVSGFPRHQGIMYHPLNEITETEGCFGPGYQIGRYFNGALKGTHFIRNSQAAYIAIWNEFNKIYDPVTSTFKEEVNLFVHRENQFMLYKGEKKLVSY